MARDVQLRRRRIRRLQKYLLNPPLRPLVLLGLLPGYTVVETVGRKTGRRRGTVVGYSVQDGALWVVAEQGRHSDYVRNIEANPRVRVRLRGRWRAGEAEIVDTDDPHRRLDAFGRRSHATTVRSFGTALLSLRITVR